MDLKEAELTPFQHFTLQQSTAQDGWKRQMAMMRGIAERMDGITWPLADIKPEQAKPQLNLLRSELNERLGGNRLMMRRLLGVMKPYVEQQALNNIQHKDDITMSNSPPHTKEELEALQTDVNASDIKPFESDQKELEETHGDHPRLVIPKNPNAIGMQLPHVGDFGRFSGGVNRLIDSMQNVQRKRAKLDVDEEIR